MNRNTAIALIAAFLVIALVLAVIGWQRSKGDTDPVGDAAAAGATEGVVVPFDLYFPGPSGRLVPERREIAVPTEPVAKAQVLVEALLAGGTAEELMTPFPEGVTLQQIYLGGDGVAYVDFASEGEVGPPAGGSEMETLRIYSVVNSIALNVPEIRRVVLLWNGRQPDSLSGHIDTVHPLGPRSDLIER